MAKCKIVHRSLRNSNEFRKKLTDKPEFILPIVSERQPIHKYH